MRYLLIVLVVALLAWRWRLSRTKGDSTVQRRAPAQPISMSRCARCGVHLPASEAIAGDVGVYCSQEHRRQAEP